MFASCKAPSYQTSTQSNILISNREGKASLATEIQLKQLINEKEILDLSNQLKIEINDLKSNKFYLAISPKQMTGGYKFIAIKKEDKLIICLDKPKSTDSVLMVLTNPIALIESSTDLNLTISYCQN